LNTEPTLEGGIIAVLLARKYVTEIHDTDNCMDGSARQIDWLSSPLIFPLGRFCDTIITAKIFGHSK
jgi:hypothetical protein